jgi:hypothetical protein
LHVLWRFLFEQCYFRRTTQSYGYAHSVSSTLLVQQHIKPGDFYGSTHSYHNSQLN